jgi:hypothetical protein
MHHHCIESIYDVCMKRPSSRLSKPLLRTVFRKDAPNGIERSYNVPTERLFNNSFTTVSSIESRKIWLERHKMARMDLGDATMSTAQCNLIAATEPHSSDTPNVAVMSRSDYDRKSRRNRLRLNMIPNPFEESKATSRQTASQRQRFDSK